MGNIYLHTHCYRIYSRAYIQTHPFAADVPRGNACQHITICNSQSSRRRSIMLQNKSLTSCINQNKARAFQITRVIIKLLLGLASPFLSAIFHKGWVGWWGVWWEIAVVYNVCASLKHVYVQGDSLTNYIISTAAKVKTPDACVRQNLGALLSHYTGMSWGRRQSLLTCYSLTYGAHSRHLHASTARMQGTCFVWKR